MTKREAQSYADTCERLRALGFDRSEVEMLLRIERTLQRWGERECGDECGCIHRDEETGKPYWLHADTGRRQSIPDNEKFAKHRLERIMAAHPELVAYHQTDCRGCNLYVLRQSDIPEGTTLESVYNRGVACCY